MVRYDEHGDYSDKHLEAKYHRWLCLKYILYSIQNILVMIWVYYVSVFLFLKKHDYVIMAKTSSKSFMYLSLFSKA